MLINILANNIINQIMVNNKIISLIISTFYIFNLSINLQYKNIKYKELFIDLGFF